MCVIYDVCVWLLRTAGLGPIPAHECYDEPPSPAGPDSDAGHFSGRGDFSLGVNMGSDSTPPETLSDESIN